MQYELFYLIGASKEAELDKIKKDIAEIVTGEDGVFAEKQVIEKRRLAYEVSHENRGFYVAQRFELEDPSRIQKITRKLNLYTGILRSVITRTDELPELTSREERENLAKKVQPRPETRKEQPAEAKAPAPKAEEKEATGSAAEEKMKEEDIDKKLEEILNI